MGRRERERARAERRLEKILEAVRRIPRGSVATYGQIAAAAGFPGRARLVGWALSHFGEGVPWQRVVGASGRISPRGEPGDVTLQRALLLAEGVAVSEAGKVDLRLCGWRRESRVK